MERWGTLSWKAMVTRVLLAPLPQQQNTFRLADPPFPVTRMAFPFLRRPDEAGVQRSKWGKGEKKKHAKGMEKGWLVYCSTMTELLSPGRAKSFAIARGIIRFIGARLPKLAFLCAPRFTNIARRNGI